MGPLAWVYVHRQVYLCPSACSSGSVLQPAHPAPKQALSDEPCSATAPGLDLADLPVDLYQPGPLEAFGRCDTFVNILETFRPIDFVKGTAGFKVYIVHHMLPGALTIRCNQENYDTLLAGLRQVIMPQERIATTTVFDTTAPANGPFRVVHIFAAPTNEDEIAVTVLIPQADQLHHAIVGPALQVLPTFSLHHILYKLSKSMAFQVPSTLEHCAQDPS